MKHNGHLLALLAMLLLVATVPRTNGQNPPGPGAGEPTQGAVGGDPIRQLNLTPEQREQIRAIREQSRNERAAMNARVRETNRALDSALDSDNPDETLIEQHVREVAAAQAAVMRMRILTEIRIRRVLTLEQRNTLRSLQRQVRELRLERLQENSAARQKRQEDRSQGLQNQRNSLDPVFPRRPAPRRRF